MSDYGHALAWNWPSRSSKKDLADKLAAELRKRAKKSGDHVYWTTAGFSRWGDNTTEITAMVMKALVAHDPNDPLIPGVLAFFHATKRGDRWDSTKDTACVLYALCDYLAAVRAGPAASGLVKVSVNGAAGGEVKLDGPASKVIKLDGKTMKPGENVFKISGADSTGGALARVVVSYSRGKTADIPARDHGVKVERTISVRNADGELDRTQERRNRAARQLRQGPRGRHAAAGDGDQLHAARKPEARRRRNDPGRRPALQAGRGCHRPRAARGPRGDDAPSTTSTPRGRSRPSTWCWPSSPASSASPPLASN